MGKNTSGELSATCVISTGAPQMLPILVFFGGRASFGVLIQMTSTINLCKVGFFSSSKRAGNFSHSIILGGGRGTWTALKAPSSKPELFSLLFPHHLSSKNT